MMSDNLPDDPPPQIPLKFRTIAAFLHALFAIPMGMTVTFYLWMLLVGDSQMSDVDGPVAIGPYFFIFLTLPMTLIWPIINWIAWASLRNIHPFVDLAGRNALNYALANLILTLGLTVMVFIAIGFLDLYKVPYFNDVSFGILNFVGAAFVIHSLVASIFAFRNKRYQSRLIYPFVRDK
jgi:uncharacterized Tic20 family protein